MIKKGGGYLLYLGDSLEISKHIDADVVITDPPYGINGGSGGINKKRNKGGYIKGYFEDTSEYVDLVCVEIIKTCIQRVGSVILTPGIKNMCSYPQPDSFGSFYHGYGSGMQLFGQVDSQPIFYYGRNPTGMNLGKKLSWKMTTSPDKTPHPCRKPTKEWEQLILEHTLEGQTVFDPFMGSGITGEICAKNNRNFIGAEIIPEYFELSYSRIKNACGELSKIQGEPSEQKSLFWEVL